LLVRSWNLFHGNAHPPERKGYLAEMVRLASADHPDVLCLQELPVWSLASVGDWSGMTAIGDVAKRPLLPAPFAKALTRLHQGLFRSAFTGEAIAILLREGLRPLEHRMTSLSRREHRICQAVRLEGDVVVANLHASGSRLRIAEAEVKGALDLVNSFISRVTILAGDFNFRPLIEGFSAPGPGIDHVLVRGAEAEPLLVWPPERRTIGGRMLSDHAPVELRVH
jgi:endonuclease/exonuclease/phosphatase family metal-dependent hydrolase